MEDLIIGAVNRSDASAFKRLKEGKTRIVAEIDLHGYSLADARVEFYEFIQACYDAKLRTVLVVTGKGDFTGGVGKIKDSITSWINDPDIKKIILTLCYAPASMGGSGALLFLLKRKL